MLVTWRWSSLDKGVNGMSVTRLGEISPFWQNFKSLRQIFEGLFLIWQNVESTWQNFCIIGLIFIVVVGQILKNNLTNWSHCLACQITSPFNKKIVLKGFLFNFILKQPILLLNGEIIWQASGFRFHDTSNQSF